jgi:hypothetical protein
MRKATSPLEWIAQGNALVSTETCHSVKRDLSVVSKETYTYIYLEWIDNGVRDVRSKIFHVVCHVCDVL